MIEMHLFIVKDVGDKLVAVFTDEEDCTDFIQHYYYERNLDYVKLVI